MELAAGHQQLPIFLQKINMREAPLRMARLRPGIAEVDEKAVHLRRRENRFDMIDVEDEEAHIRKLLLLHLSGRRIKHVLLCLDADEIDAGKAWLSKSADIFRVAKPMMDFVNSVIDDYE